jgi:hypothetical protein
MALLLSRLMLVAVCAFVVSSPFILGEAAADNILRKCPESTSVRWHNCFGTYTSPDGDKYVGSFMNDKIDGRGTLTFADGSKYVGEFKDDERHGQGTYTFADGRNYVGEFKDGNFNGQGTFTLASGSKYVGEFKGGNFNGQGTYTSANGDKYVGSFKDDTFNGQGTFTYADGRKYVGEFKGDNFNGQGTFTLASGSKYVGEFKEGMVHGRAVNYAVDGSIMQQGIFERGVFVKAETIMEPSQVVGNPPQQQQQSVVQSSIPVPTNERKVALVIGNGAYRDQGRLKNPKNDAKAMSAMLERLGFVVVFGVDLPLTEMRVKVREFIKQAQQADVSLLFYSGHGMQVSGQNYLIPVDASVEDATALDFELVKVSSITNHMSSHERVGIVLLDACRTNPFTKSLMRSLGNRASAIGNGLAPISAPAGGLLVGYATAPDDVASDGSGNNSPFTIALLNHLSTPGLEIELIMKQVKADVINMTKNMQRPWHNSDLARNVYLTNMR